MDFTTFKHTLMEYLPEETDISIGDDFSINYHILVDNDGYIHLKQKGSFLRAKTSICINSIEFRKQAPPWEDSFYMINDKNALYFDADEDEFYFLENGSNPGWGSAFDYFTRFPFGTKAKHFVWENGNLVLK